MATFAGWVDRLRGLDLERALGLRATLPRVTLELDRPLIALVRLRPVRGGRLVLEDHQLAADDEPAVPASIFDSGVPSVERLAERFRGVFERSGIRPGRVGLVLPDNLAKVALVSLPERPPSRRQLLELIRFKLHRSVPFRLVEAAVTYQLLPGDGPGVTVLVALTRQPLVGRYEQALESIGARPGLIDLCTPNLLNLCRTRIQELSAAGDVALLNCTTTYFSLAILRGARLVFFRCKNLAAANGDGREGPRADGLFAREIAGSVSYYREKLGGQGIASVLVRSVAGSVDEIAAHLGELGASRIEGLEPAVGSALGPGVALEPGLAHRLAPALGVAVGRG